MKIKTPTDLEALILCGGLGTRLRKAVPDRPKALAPVAGRVFLDFLLEELSSEGIRRFILCTGYGRHQVEEHIQQNHIDRDVEFSPEPHPLGTGGAVSNALERLRGQVFVVANGDTLCECPVPGLLKAHCDSGALVTMVVSRRYLPGAYGSVRLGKRNEVLAIEPAHCTGAELVHAGIMILGRQAVSRLPSKEQSSLEQDLLQPLIREGSCNVFEVEAPVLDIGTPERLAFCEEYLRNH